MGRGDPGPILPTHRTSRLVDYSHLAQTEICRGRLDSVDGRHDVNDLSSHSPKTLSGLRQRGCSPAYLTRFHRAAGEVLRPGGFPPDLDSDNHQLIGSPPPDPP
jgi:hypothetical protein